METDTIPQSEIQNPKSKIRHGFPDWMIIALLLLLILAKGIFAFLVVGNLGQPSWDYRPVSDVPASSPYGVYEPLPYPQHIQGEKGE